MSDSDQKVVVPEKREAEGISLPAWGQHILAILEEPDPPLSREEQGAWRKMAAAQLERLSAVEWRNLEHWKQEWFQWLLMVYELIAESGVDLSALACGEDCPRWVQQLETRLGQIWGPSLNMKAIARSPAVQLGGVVGHEFCAWSRVREHALPGAESLKGEVRGLLVALLERFKAHRLDRVRRSVEIGLGLPLAESKAFFRGFAAGLNTDAFEPEQVLIGDQRLSLTYHLLYFHWPYIEGLGSAADCYCWLRSQIGKLAGPKLAELGLRGRDREQNPGYERLRKILQRLGKSFAEADGGSLTSGE